MKYGKYTHHVSASTNHNNYREQELRLRASVTTSPTHCPGRPESLTGTSKSIGMPAEAQAPKSAATIGPRRPSAEERPALAV